MKPLASPGEAQSPDFRQVLSVTQAVEKLRRPLEEIQPFWIEGEISGLRPWRGYLFFTLRDRGAQIRCVLFGNASAYKPERDGEKVLIFGKPEIFTKRGELQIQVLRAEPSGVGAMAVALERLKKKLAGEGVFKNERPLPVFPQRVGVITSAESAAFKDIQKIFSSDRSLSIVLFPSRVQGDGATVEIAQGINLFSESDGIDVILLARGGGSQQDLWPFQSESVARALFMCRIPTVCAVGHETDTTVADLAADMRAATPTHGARLILDQRQAARDRLQFSSKALYDLVSQVQDEAKTRIESLHMRRWGKRLLQRVDRDKAALEQAEKGLAGGMKQLTLSSRTRVREQGRRLSVPLGLLFEKKQSRLIRIAQNQSQALSVIVERQRERLQRAVVGLEARSPLAILARGYSITKDKATGKVLRDARRTKPGDEIEIDLAQGGLDCRVEKVRTGDSILP